MKHKLSPRAGISLIEILVVISIIGVLMAISAGAVFRLRATQDKNNSEGTLSKMHSNLMSRWSAILDAAKKDVPQDVVNGVAQGDKDRARAIWTYAKLQNEFPQTFLEAKRTINFGPGATLRPRKVFEAVADNPANASLSLEMQSAVLIAAALTQTGNAGNYMGLEGLQNQVAPHSLDGTGSDVFWDSWGAPIIFVRHATSPEIDAEPFLRLSSIKLPNGSPLAIHNPLDPQGRLIPHAGNPQWPTSAAHGQVLSALGLPPSEFTNRNILPTLISAGKNKRYGVNPFDPNNDDSADNVLSYRLRREGDRGN